MDISIADQVRQAFAFSIDKLPLYGPEGIKTPYYGLFRSDNGEVASSHTFSRLYRPHETDDVIALVEACSEAFGGIGRVSCRFDDGHHVVVAPSKEHRQSIYGERDNIWPRLIIRAGYDGRAFRGTLGTYRDACRNLAIVRRVAGVTESIRHTSGLRSEMAELIATFQVLASRWQNIGEAAREMEQRRVRLAEFILAVYGEPNERSQASMTRHRNRTEAIMRRVIRERMTTGRPDIGNDYVVSGWEAFNAVQGYTQHDSSRKGRPDDLSRALLALEDSHVSRAERLAFEMAI